MATTLKTTRIYKKVSSTPTPTYWLYHPQTGGNQVLINSTNVAGGYITDNWMDVDGKTSTTASASYPYTPLEPYLAWMAKQIDNFGNVIEFVGAYTSLTAGLSANEATIDNAKGEVYINTSSITTHSDCSWTQVLNNNTWSISVDPAGVYPENTLYVVSSMPATHALVFTPLGGDNSTYATKAQAIGTVTLSGSTIHVESIDGTKTGNLTFPTIGTTPASSVAITNTISSSTSASAIPNVQAVRDYASSAGKVKEALADTGYLVGTDAVATSDPAALTPVGADIKWATTSAAAGTASKYINVHITGTAAKLINTLTISGTATYTFDGSESLGIRLGGGLTSSVTGGGDVNIAVNPDDSKGITLTSVGIGAKVTHGITVSSNGIGVTAYQAHGITVDSNGVGVNAGDGLNYSSNKVAVKPGDGITVSTAGVGLAASGIDAGTYSAIQVDTYGRALAGGQSVVFAENIDDPDLNSLVIGGLAFVGTDATYTDSANTTHSIPQDTNPIIG